MLHGFGFDVDVLGWNPEDFGNPGLHFGKVRQQLWPLRQDVRVDIADLVSLLSNKIGSLPQELQTRNTFETAVRVREHLSDITQATRAEQRVRDGMTQNISVRMSDQSLFMPDLDAAQNQ